MGKNIEESLNESEKDEGPSNIPVWWTSRYKPYWATWSGDMEGVRDCVKARLWFEAKTALRADAYRLDQVCPPEVYEKVWRILEGVEGS